MSRRRSLLLLAAVLSVLVLPAPAAFAADADPYVVVLSDSVQGVDAAIDRRERSRGFRARLRFSHAIKGFSARLDAAQVAALRSDPNVVAVARDRPVHASAAVPLSAGEPVPPPGVRRIAAATRTSVRAAADSAVAVIDTGIDLTHPDLNAVSGTDCVAPGTPADDDDGHGTHVAGTIAARNDGAGVTGVAPGTRVYAVKVLDSEGSGSWSQVICGIDWVTANAARLGIRVANLSLGGPGSDDGNCGRSDGDVLHRAICRSAAAGVLNVVAAGNDAVDAVGDAPASYSEVLTVTAMADRDGAGGGVGGSLCGESDDARASFSNFVSSAADLAHTVAAPGVCIRSTLPGGRWGTMSGTSMAAPHVAGAVALCVGEAGVAGPCAGMTPAQIVTYVGSRAADRAAAEPAWGFLGDPLRPLAGKAYGHLIDAAWPAVVAPPADEEPASTPADEAPAETPPDVPDEAPAGDAPDDAPATDLPPADTPAAEVPATGPPLADVPLADTPLEPATRTLSLRVRSRSLREVLRRGLRLTLRCTPACAAPPRVVVRAGGYAAIATARASSSSPGRTIVVRLPRAARRRLAQRSAVRFTVRAAAGAGARATARFTLR